MKITVTYNTNDNDLTAANKVEELEALIPLLAELKDHIPCAAESSKYEIYDWDMKTSPEHPFAGNLKVTFRRD